MTIRAIRQYPRLESFKTLKDAETYLRKLLVSLQEEAVIVSTLYRTFVEGIISGSEFSIIEFVDSLPDAGTAGRAVYLTTDKKLYIDDGTAWVVLIIPASVYEHIGGLDVAVITAGQIAAKAITAEKLSIASITDNMVLNPSFEHEGGWAIIESIGAATYSTADKTEGSYSLLLDAPIAAWGCLAVPLVPGDKYTVRVKIKGTSATGAGLYIRMQEKDSYPSGGYVTGVLRDSYTDFVTNGAVPNTWTTYEHTYTVPANVYWGSFSIYNYTGGPAGGVYIDEAEVRKQLAGVHIEDGVITADKILAGTITADEIHANTITADNLVSSQRVLWHSTPSASVRNSNNTEQGPITATSYTKVKEIKLNEDTGKLRIYFQLKTNDAVNQAFAKIYKNGVALGTERTTVAEAYQAYSQDLGPFSEDDLLQIYAHRNQGGAGATYVQNFQLLYDRAVSILAGHELATAITTAAGEHANFSVTNQDP